MKRWFKAFMQETPEETEMGLTVQFERALPSRQVQEFLHDLDLFVANWRVAESTLRLQDRIVRERMEMAKSYGQV